MISHIDKCVEIARDLGTGVENMDEIILVTGCHLARSWINVTFPKNQESAEVSFGIRRPGPSEVHFGEGDIKRGDVKFGPRGKVSF
jgi:hypothetical protein